MNRRLFLISALCCEVALAAPPVAISFTGQNAYHCIENRSQWVSLSATSDLLTYPLHDYLDHPAINWSTRYTQGIADYLGTPTNVGAVAISTWTIKTVPINGTLYKLGDVTDSTPYTDAPVSITAGYTDSYPDGYLYVPNNSWTGTDTFTYTATDSNGESSAATVEIVVTAAGSWIPPFGIPNPNFGIASSPPADPGNWPSAEAANFYYIDKDHVSATDTANTYGYPDKPRLTLPPTSTTVTAGGKIVIKAATTSYSLRDFTWHRWDLTGTSENPVWVVGVNNGTSRPVITSHANQSGIEALRVNGDYYVFDGVVFHEMFVDRRTDVGTNSNTTFRHCEFRGFRRNTNGGSVLSMGPTGGSNNLVFGCYIHNNGRILTDLSEERDNHGIVSGNGSSSWYLDSLSHHNAGDTFQAGNNNTSSAVYMGRVKAHSDGENAVDIKDFNNYVVSQCDGWDYRRVNYGNSGGSAQIFYVNDEGTQTGFCYFLLNRAWDSNGAGISSAMVGTGKHYMIGNRVFHCPSGDGFGSGTGGGEMHWYLNTVADCSRGMYLYTPGSNPVRYCAGNYILQSGLYSMFTAASYSGIDSCDYNVFDASGTLAWGSSTTPTTGTHSAWNAATGFGANDMTAAGDDLISSTGFNFRLIANADAIDFLPAASLATKFPGLDDMETDLGVTVIDFLGTARPSNIDYDAGAHEYVPINNSLTTTTLTVGP